MKNLLVLVTWIAAAAPVAFAGALQQAAIHQIVNDVQLVDPAKGAHRAALEEVVHDDLAVRTGQKSRAELLFQDETLTRLGAETFFSFKAGTRDLSLERGTLLLQVPKGLGGARIRTASVTASITGTTIMMELLPKQHLKVVVLEGSLRLAVNGRLGESILLTPGKMVIMDPSAKSIPNPVDVDLRKLVKTSSLINASGGRGKGKAIAELPSIGLINQEIAQQDQMVKDKGLVRTNLVIAGSGTEVVAANDLTLALLDRGDLRGLKTQLPSEIVPTGMGKDGPGFGGGKGSDNNGGSTSGGGKTTGSGGGKGDGGSSDGGGGSSGGDSNGDGGSSGDNGGGDNGGGDNGGGDNGGGDNGGGGDNDGSGGDNGDGGDDGDGDGGSDGGDGDPAGTVDVLQTAGFQVPNFNASAPAPTSASTHAAPVSITAPNPFSTASATGPVRFTLDASGPKLTAHANTFTGTIYGGKALDGSAAQFLFGASSAFDGKVRFDSRFGIGNQPAFADAGVAAFKFDALQLGGTPRFQSTGLADLALVSVGDLTTSPNGGRFDLSNLRSLTLATVNGAISLDSGLVGQASGNEFRFLHLYARGANGNVTLGEGFQLPGRALFVDAENRILFAAGSTVRIANGAFNSLGGITLDGTLTADTVQLASTGALSLGGTLDATRLFAYGASFALTGGSVQADTLSIQTSGAIAAGGPGVLQGKVITLEAGGQLFLNQTDATVTRLDLSLATSLDASGRSIVFGGGDFTVPAGVTAKLASTGGGIDASGSRLSGFRSINARGGDLQALAIQGGDLAGSARLIVAGDAAARSVNMGGDIFVGGALSAANGNISGGAIDAARISATGDLKARGDVFTHNLRLGGKLDIDGALRPHGNEVSSTADSFTATEFKARGGVQFGGTAGTLTIAPTSGGNIAFFSPTSSVAAKSGDDDDDDDDNDEGGDDSDKTLKIAGDGINGVNLNGGAAAVGEGGDGGTLQIGTAAQPFSGKIEINAPITATTGANGTATLYGGKGGTVSIVSKQEILVKSTIQVSDTATGRASRRGGNIALESRATKGKAITIQSSGQLLSLLNTLAPGPGGSIKFTSAGGDISVDGGTVAADRGSVEMVNNGRDGLISLKNANVRGDVVKIGALGANGQLIIRGGSINADTTLKLYGGTAAGEVRFVDNVTLGGLGTKIIAGRTVTIDSSKVVTVGGLTPAQVFTDHGNYTGSGGNGSTSGRFGGAGAVTGAFSGRPGF